MNVKYIIVLTAAVLLAGYAATAQTSFKPEIYGVVKTKFEVSAYDGEHRFNVRNSRLGVRGYATPNMRYALQLELNSQGKFDILDSYAAYKIGKFDISLGQQQYKFSTELNRGAGRNYFANRSFVGKFVSRYYNIDNTGAVRVNDIGSRDIGALLQYKSATEVPVLVCFGAFNGEGINNPSWNKYINLLGHVEVGGINGFGGGASYYHGKSPLGDKMRMWGLEGRYVDSRIRVEAEFAKRYLDINNAWDVMTVAVVHAMYTFPFPENKFAESFTPMLRYDYGDNIKYVNMATDLLDAFSGHRLTAGLTVGLATKLLKSELRFNYDWYMPNTRPSDLAVNKLFQNKFTIEFFAAF